MRKNSISFIFLEFPHQEDMKNIVKSSKHFFGYFNTLGTHSENCELQSCIAVSKIFVRGFPETSKQAKDNLNKLISRLAHIQFKCKATQKRLGQTLMRNLNKNNLYFLNIKKKLVKMQHSTVCRPLDRGEGGLNVVRF